MVEVVTSSVDIGFSSRLEGCACLEPATEKSELRPGVYFRLVEFVCLISFAVVNQCLLALRPGANTIYGGHLTSVSS